MAGHPQCAQKAVSGAERGSQESTRRKGKSASTDGAARQRGRRPAAGWEDVPSRAWPRRWMLGAKSSNCPRNRRRTRRLRPSLRTCLEQLRAAAQPAQSSNAAISFALFPVNARRRGLRPAACVAERCDSWWTIYVQVIFVASF